MRALTNYFDEGRTAYCDEIAVDDCPYADGSVRYFEWRPGWFETYGNDPFAFDHLGDRDPLDLSHPSELAKCDANSSRRSAEFRINQVRQLLPTMDQIVELLGPPEGWVHNCYATATQLLGSGLLQPIVDAFGPLRLGYGNYDGWVAKDTPYHGKPVIRHGWIELEEGIVIDPTQWVFTGDEPSLAVVGITDYDFGACRFKQSVRQDVVPPAYEPEHGVIRWTVNDPTISDFAAALLGDHSRISDGFLSRGQAHWLGNRPLSVLRELRPIFFEHLTCWG